MRRASSLRDAHCQSERCFVALGTPTRASSATVLQPLLPPPPPPPHRCNYRYPRCHRFLSSSQQCSGQARDSRDFFPISQFRRRQYLATWMLAVMKLLYLRKCTFNPRHENQRTSSSIDFAVVPFFFPLFSLLGIVTIFTLSALF